MRADRGRTLALLTVAAILLGAAAAHAESVSLTWTAPGDDWLSGRASSYEIRYSTNPVSPDTSSWWASATSIGSLPTPRTAGTRESFVVVGLDPGTTYYFCLRTKDEVPNVSAWSNIARKTTTSTPVTLATPGNFAAEVIGGDVLLTWNAIPAGGPEVGYRLYRQATAEPSAQLLATLPVAASSWTDTTAATGTTYEFSIASYDDNGEGTPAVTQVTTPGPSTVVAATPEVVHGYPNPARDQVTFRLNVDDASSAGRTRVTVFDLTGHKICQLADREFAPGQHAISWACRSDAGYHVAPGIYNVIVDGPKGRAVTRVAIVP